MELIWFSEHHIKGNGKADECQVNGSHLEEAMTWNEVYPIDDCKLREIKIRWS